MSYIKIKTIHTSMCIQNIHFFICGLTTSDPTCAYLQYLLLNLIFYPRKGHNKSVLVFCNTTTLTTSLIKCVTTHPMLPLLDSIKEEHKG